MCTYLNYESAKKCTVCQTPRGKPLIIEEVAIPSSSALSDGSAFAEEEEAQETEERWTCPACTYLNCLRTKRCVQCYTDRPLRYGSDPAINGEFYCLSNNG